MRETTLNLRPGRFTAGLALGLLVLAMGAPVARAQATAPVPTEPVAAAPAVLLGDVAFPVQQWAVEGVTVFEPAELLRFAMAMHQGAGGHALSAQSLANAMALMYREDGYALADVVWRADAAAARVVWTVHEGHIERVTLTGLDAATTARTLRYLQPLTTQRPLHQADLERALALADDLAGTSLISRVLPLVGGSGSELIVSGEAFHRRGGLVFDMVPMRPGHARRLHWHEERYGLLQPGDLTRVYATATRDPQDGESLLGGIHHRAPVGDEGAYVELLAGNARAERGLSNTLDRSELRGRNVSLAWGHPFQRDLHSHGYWIAALDHADSTARLGERQPRSQATAARLYLLQGRTGGDERLLQYALTLSAGARPSAAVLDGERHFQHLRAGLGLAGPWRLGSSVMTYRLEGAAQWAARSLPRVERFVLGHFPYLRGYAPAEVDGDRGVGFTLELVRQGDLRGGLARVKPFVFVAGGTVSSLRPQGVASWSLASVGAGLRTTLGERVGIEAWAAVPLRDGPQSQRGKAALFVALSTPL
ncbi:MAG: ShlB/FhaC/HecB family hemolysin secretion/activation protein [Hydrogenophaga sp.]|nr:ShlB/FhaC/HecB family hemolysin secretion/activation protein [Hydrogenophaga sp.]